MAMISAFIVFYHQKESAPGVTRTRGTRIRNDTRSYDKNSIFLSA
jgi:hypothetical protein